MDWSQAKLFNYVSSQVLTAMSFKVVYDCKPMQLQCHSLLYATFCARLYFANDSIYDREAENTSWELQLVVSVFTQARSSKSYNYLMIKLSQRG